MAPRTQTKTAQATAAALDPLALSPEDLEAIGLELDAPVIGDRIAAPLSPRERLIASLLPDRAHLDGCPSMGPDGGALIEASDETAPAPGPALRRLGAVAGSAVTTIRCVQCGGSTHRVGTVRDVLRAELVRRAGEADDGDLDTTL